jgi:signal peptidase II
MQEESNESSLASPWIPFVLTVALVLLLDIVSKLVVIETLGPDSARHSVHIASTVVELDYEENSGIAFGLLSNDSVVVWILVSLAILGMTAVIWTTIASASRSMAIAIGLIAGGGLANLIDRIVDGHVVDFISLWQWPSFNLADASITIGAAAVLLLVFRQEHPQRQ